jgi:hypothetical protein
MKESGFLLQIKMLVFEDFWILENSLLCTRWR